MMFMKAFPQLQGKAKSRRHVASKAGPALVSAAIVSARSVRVRGREHAGDPNSRDTHGVDVKDMPHACRLTCPDAQGCRLISTRKGSRTAALMVDNGMAMGAIDMVAPEQAGMSNGGNGEDLDLRRATLQVFSHRSFLSTRRARHGPRKRRILQMCMRMNADMCACA